MRSLRTATSRRSTPCDVSLSIRALASCCSMSTSAATSSAMCRTCSSAATRAAVCASARRAADVAAFQCDTARLHSRCRSPRTASRQISILSPPFTRATLSRACSAASAACDRGLVTLAYPPPMRVAWWARVCPVKPTSRSTTISVATAPLALISFATTTPVRGAGSWSGLCGRKWCGEAAACTVTV